MLEGENSKAKTENIKEKTNETPRGGGNPIEDSSSFQMFCAWQCDHANQTNARHLIFLKSMIVISSERGNTWIFRFGAHGTRL